MKHAWKLTLIPLVAGMLIVTVAAEVLPQPGPLRPQAGPQTGAEGPAPAAAPVPEVSRERVQPAIERYVEDILGFQANDGSFMLMGVIEVPLYDQAGTTRMDYAREYPVGQTALGLLALRYARPHLSGDILQRTERAVQKAESYIVQHALERKTYSAGLVISALVMGTPERYRKMIGDYASMLVATQHKVNAGEAAGQWGYSDDAWSDNSNNQFALLGLYMASRAGFQAPRRVWEGAANHYVKTQVDGGWGYRRLQPKPTISMTIASTVSLHLCEEMLLSDTHAKCKPFPHLKAIDEGLRWIADHWMIQWKDSTTTLLAADAYGLYALERLGILMGRANIGGHDWYNEVADVLLRVRMSDAKYPLERVDKCFSLIFLARGLEPVVINKLERRGTDDWNNDAYDVQHLVDYLQDHCQQAVQWRIITLEAPAETLQRAPILFINGHEKLEFNDDEKAKLKAYVAGGGTILAEACCSRREFAVSVRARVKELFGEDLKPLPPDHALFAVMKRGVNKPAVEHLPLAGEGGRPGVLLLPGDLSCRWHAGGARAQEAFEIGAGIYQYVTGEGRRLFEAAHPATIPTPGPAAPVAPTQERGIEAKLEVV